MYEPATHEDSLSEDARPAEALNEDAGSVAAQEVVSAVPDPEMPYITLGDLGVVGAVHVNEDARAVRVELTPTYLGCPATEVIQQDVKAALLDAGWRSVAIELRFEPPWTPDRITQQGRAKLAAEGIAPPSGHTGPKRADSGPVLVTLGRAPADVRCPHCGAARTDLLSAFGPAPCQELRRCASCREPFPAIKRAR
jgi:ring-1,2-phenylacetyl-CoA epoxidase subunit PaaD